MAKYQYKVKGVDYEVEIQDIEGNIANVTVNGIPFEVEMKQPVKAGKQKFRIANEATDDKGGVSSADSAKTNPTGSSASSANAEAAASKKVSASAGDKPVVAPLPGTNDIKVKVGDKVSAGDTVVILEAMKMENNIEAETSGTVASINVNKGDAVMEGDTLVTIA